MKINPRLNSRKLFGFLAIIGFGLLPVLKADVVVLQSGMVITGQILQQDTGGVLLQTTSGTYRYPLASITDIKKETLSAPHVSNNGQIIPDWAQIISLLATNDWAGGLKQVPATMIETGVWKNVPYVSFRCGSGGYEMNVFGDLNNPAAVQIGAMNYLHQTSTEKSNCVNFMCSVLASAADRKLVRALNYDQKDVAQNAGMTIETILPGEWGSYGGWWVSVKNDNALASAQASEAELLAITQSRTAVIATNVVTQPGVIPVPQTAVPSTQPVTTTGVVTSDETYGTASGWTASELADARPGAPASTAPVAVTGEKVYPRTYNRTDGTYGLHR